MKKLLCILNNMNMGGAETFLMKVYRVLDRSRWRMDFCINYAGHCDYEDEILQSGGRIFRITPKSQDSKEFKRQLTAVIQENSYTNVLRITSNAAGFWDLKIAKKAGATHTAARSSNANDGGLVQYMLHRFCRVIWTRYVDVKIAPSDLAAIYTFGEKAYRSGEVRILNNGLDLSLFRYSEEQRNALRSELHIAPETKVLGHIGRFNTQKNHSFLIHIFHRFRQAHPDSVLILVGAGDLEEQIKALVRELQLSDSVIFTGLRSDIPALLSAFDVLLLPSLYEGMPNVVIEAQACGLPCVLSDTVTKDADVSGKLVYLPLSDEQKWVDAAERSLADGRIQSDMSAYDIHTVARQFCDYCFTSEGANS